MRIPRRFRPCHASDTPLAVQVETSPRVGLPAGKALAEDRAYAYGITGSLHMPRLCATVAVLAGLALALVAGHAAAAPRRGPSPAVAGGGAGADGVQATSSAASQARRVAPLPEGDLLIVEFGG